jgi:hypothetical protein
MMEFDPWTLGAILRPAKCSPSEVGGYVGLSVNCAKKKKQVR